MAMPALARLPAPDDDTKIRISELKESGVSAADLARRYHLSPPRIPQIAREGRLLAALRRATGAAA